MCQTMNTCLKCPIYTGIEEEYGCDECKCKQYIYEHTDKAEQIIKKWTEEHPEKTYAQDFFEKFPYAHFLTSDEGLKRPLKCCVKQIYGIEVSNCIGKSCSECWNQPMKE